MRNPEMMAACGLDCGTCSIRRYAFDDEAAAEVLPWFRAMGWLAEGEGRGEAIAMKMLCSGCRGDRSLHWSADCWILLCCVDQRHLRNCSQCTTFPCDRLVEWAKTDDSYGKAFARLQSLGGARGA